MGQDGESTTVCARSASGKQKAAPREALHKTEYMIDTVTNAESELATESCGSIERLLEAILAKSEP